MALISVVNSVHSVQLGEQNEKEAEDNYDWPLLLTLALSALSFIGYAYLYTKRKLNPEEVHVEYKSLPRDTLLRETLQNVPVYRLSVRDKGERKKLNWDDLYYMFHTNLGLRHVSTLDHANRELEAGTTQGDCIRLNSFTDVIREKMIKWIRNKTFEQKLALSHFSTFTYCGEVYDIESFKAFITRFTMEDVALHTVNSHPNEQKKQELQEKIVRYFNKKFYTWILTRCVEADFYENGSKTEALKRTAPLFLVQHSGTVGRDFRRYPGGKAGRGNIRALRYLIRPSEDQTLYNARSNSSEQRELAATMRWNALVTLIQERVVEREVRQRYSGEGDSGGAVTSS